MVFIHDTRSALEVTVAVVNSLPSSSSEGLDTLTSIEDLTEFLTYFPYTGRLTLDEDELAGLRAVRPRLAQLWDVDRDGAVPLVNAMLSDGAALPQLAIHDGYDWHVHATSDDAELATRIMVETAMAFVDIIRSDEYQRVRRCEADDCESVYIDYSRNGSKRYCDEGNCGNRMNVNAYRARKAAETL